jgi:hypothetical protein
VHYFDLLVAALVYLSEVFCFPVFLPKRVLPAGGEIAVLGDTSSSKTVDFFERLVSIEGLGTSV